MRIFFVCLAVVAATACTPRPAPSAGDHSTQTTVEIIEALKKGSYVSRSNDIWETTNAVAHIKKETDQAWVELIITRPSEGRVECKVESTGLQLVDDLKRLPTRSVHDLITKYGCLP